ncbi:MAG: zinc-ribbon domain-containing protein [Candidatus Bathyarchaeota archaeon]|jgi:ribosomal protein L40E
MVYCSKCGTQNEDNAEKCSKCGASLQISHTPRRRKRVEDECFGLPHGGAIVGLIIGAIIIFWGLSQIPGLLPTSIQSNWWPLIIIIFGLLIVAGAIYGFTRRR